LATKRGFCPIDIAEEFTLLRLNWRIIGYYFDSTSKRNSRVESQ
jgi:hypothetical protein